MNQTVAPWRAVYLPGETLVLAGPTSLVALDAALDLDGVTDLWELVLASGSLPDLAHALARQFGRAPRAAVFFWTPDGIRTLLRGEVRVVDPSTAAIVADGAGVLTWKEVDLGGLERLAVRVGPVSDEVARPNAPRDRALPLVVGVVRASTVWLEAGAGDAVQSPQAEPAAESDGPAAPAEPTLALPEEPGEAPDLDPDTERLAEDVFSPAAPVPPRPEPAARLEDPDGSTVELTRPVVIGRAPSVLRAINPDPELMTVRSQNHDVSRSHAEVWVEADQVVVSDLHSTNGTVVVGPGPDGLRVTLEPGIPLAVPIGSRLLLGGEVAVAVVSTGAPSVGSGRAQA